MPVDPATNILRAAVSRAIEPAGIVAIAHTDSFQPLDMQDRRTPDPYAHGEYCRRLGLALIEAMEAIDRLLSERGHEWDGRRSLKDRWRREGLHQAMVIAHRVADELTQEIVQESVHVQR